MVVNMDPVLRATPVLHSCTIPGARGAPLSRGAALSVASAPPRTTSSDCLGPRESRHSSAAGVLPQTLE